jgi:hypothetical protein
MVAKVHWLRTKADRLKARQGEALRQMVLEYEEPLPNRAVGEILIAIDRNTEAESDDGDWRFILMGPVEFDLVCEWLEANSKRPRLATRLFRKLFQFVDRRNQEILRTRDELAELVGADPDHVSRVMSELVSIGVLRSERVPVPGLKGPGAVHWFLNPWVATHFGKAARIRAQAEAPELKLVPKPKRVRRKLEPVE